LTTFPAGKPVTGKDLVGREEIVRQILTYVTHGENVVLIAPRRFGKTSVLLETLNRIQTEDYFKIYIDLFTTPTKRFFAERITEEVLSNKRLDAIFHRFKQNVTELVQQIELRPVINDFAFIVGFGEKQKDENYLLENSLDFIDQFSLKNNCRMVCGFDEFGDIGKFDGDEILKMFRSKIQLQQNTAYIFSGSYQSVMNQIFINSSAPFYRLTRIVNLGPVPYNDFFTYLSDKFKSKEISIGDDAINRLLKFTEGHPYYTQLSAQTIELHFSPGRKADNQSITASDIPDVVEMMVQIENSYLEKVWEEICGVKENVQIILPVINGVQNLYGMLDLKKLNVSRALRRMISMGIIQKIKSRYIFTDTLLRYWIKTRVLKLDKTECV